MKPPVAIQNDGELCLAGGWAVPRAATGQPWGPEGSLSCEKQMATRALLVAMRPSGGRAFLTTAKRAQLPSIAALLSCTLQPRTLQR